MTNTHNAASTSQRGNRDRSSLARTSAVLHAILTQNPGVTSFSVEHILASIGDERFEASLMMFALPGLVPVPAPRGIVAVPTGAIACQMATGRQRIVLPKFILNKTVSRRSLAVAIHAVLPIIDAAERVVRPRWGWLSNRISRRAIGLFIFVLAVAISQPVLGFSWLSSLSICVLSLGMAERDGLAIVLGLVAGILSLAIVAAGGLSTRVLQSKLIKALRKLSRKLGFAMFAKFLDRLGYHQLARVVGFEWADLLTLWNPERPLHIPRPPRPRPVRPAVGVPITA